MAEIDRLDIVINATDKNVESKIDSIISSLDRLNQSLNLSGISAFESQFKSLSQTMKAFSDSLNLSKFSGGDFTSLANLSTAISKFSGKRVSSSATELPKIGQAVKQMLADISAAPAISKENVEALIAISKIDFSNLKGSDKNITGLSKILSSGGSSGGSSFSARLPQMPNVFKAVATATNETTVKIKSFSSSVAESVKKVTNLAGAIGILYAKYYAARRIINLFSSAISKSMNYIESYHFFDVVAKDIGKDSEDNWSEIGYDSATAYSNSFRDRLLELNTKMSGFAYDENGFGYSTGEKNLGLDSDMLLQYQAQYAQMAHGIGVSSEGSLAISKAMTMLAGDWSSLRNIDFEASFQKMASALAGMARPVRSLGIDITQTALKQTALNLGIRTSVTDMDSSSKTMLRMIAILQQSQVAFGDLAKTINTPANQMRMLKQNATALARTLGNLFLPVVAKILPYVNGLVIALQRLFQWVGKFLGIDLSDIVTSQGGLSDALEDIEDDPFEDLADAADDAADSTDKAKKKTEELKNALMSFDEINKLPDDDEDEDKETAEEKKAREKAEKEAQKAADKLKLEDLLDAALKDYEKKWNAAFAKMQNKAQEIADKLTDIFKKIYDFIMGKDWVGLGEYVAGGINKAIEGIKQFLSWDKWRGTIEPFVRNLTEAINNIVQRINFRGMGEALGNGINTLVNTLNLWYEGIDWLMMGRKLAEGFMGLVNTVDWYNLGALFGNKLRSSIEMVYGFISGINFYDMGNAIANALNGMISRIPWEHLGETFAIGFNGIFQALSEFTRTFDWKGVTEGIATSLRTFIEKADFAKAGEAINDFVDKALHWANENLAKGVPWETLGEKVGTLIKEIDWEKHLNDAIDLVKGTVGELFIGAIGGVFGDFGKNFANGFVEGFSNVLKLDVDLIKKVGDALGNFADMINKLHPKAVENLGKALGALVAVKFTFGLALGVTGFAKGLFGIKTVAASHGTISKLGWVLSGLATSVGNLLKAAGLGIGAGVGTCLLVQLAADLQKLFEVSRGENGILTDMGTAIQHMGEALSEVGGLSEENEAKLRELIDTYENLGYSNEVIAVKIMRAMGDMGVSAEQCEGILNSMAESNNYNVDVIEELRKHIDMLGEGYSKNTHIIDLSNVKGQKMIEANKQIKNSLAELSHEDEEYGLMHEEVMARLDEATGRGCSSAQDSIDSVIASLEGMGASQELIDKVSETFRTTFPDNIKEGAYNVVEVVDNTASSIESATQNTEVATDEAVRMFREHNEALKQGSEQTAKDVSQSAQDSKTAILQNANEAVAILELSEEEIQNIAATGGNGVITVIEAKTGEASSVLKSGTDAAIEILELGLEDAAATTSSNAGSVTEPLNVAMTEATQKTEESMDTIQASIENGTKASTDGLDNLSAKAEDTKGKVSGVDDILNSLLSVTGLTDAMKLAIVAIALGTVNDNSTHADESLSSLETTLSNEAAGDSYASHIGEVSTALENAGVDASEFETALLNAAKDLGVKLPKDLSVVSSSIRTEAASASKEAQTMGSKVGSSAVSGLQSESNNTRKAVESYVSNDFIGPIQQMPAKAREIGQNTGSGLKTGIGEKKAEVEKESKSLAENSIIGTLKDTLQTHSPSRITTAIGGDTGQGLINGLSGKRAELSRVSSELSESIISPFKSIDFSSIIRGYDSAIQNGLSEMRSPISAKAAEVTSEIANRFNDMISNIGEIMRNFPAYVTSGINYGYFSDAAGRAREYFLSPFNNLQNDVAYIISGINNAAYSIDTGAFYNSGSNAAQSLANGFRNVHIPTPSINITAWDSVQVGNGSMQIPRFAINWYAAGGFPKFGELFMANERGPEMVGRMGNRNVVANNNQIIEGIKQGVLDAFSSAMDNSSNRAVNSDNKPIINVYVGGRKITDVVVEQINQRTKANGFSPLLQ